MSWRFEPIALGLLLCVGAALFAHAETRFEGQGRVVAVDEAKGAVTLDHEPIPGLMAAMRMAFPVEPVSLLRGLRAGSLVRFSLRARGPEWVITAIEPTGEPAAVASRAPVRTTMEELHRHGGVPPGWKFAWPAGDTRKGREVFARLECYKCHVVQGERFRDAPGQNAASGPELSGMGGHHPPEYMAESILNPNAVIVTGPGHTGPDGLSTMPDYRDSLTVGELIDLVAYLKGLTGGHTHQPAGAQSK